MPFLNSVCTYSNGSVRDSWTRKRPQVSTKARHWMRSMVASLASFSLQVRKALCRTCSVFSHERDEEYQSSGMCLSSQSLHTCGLSVPKGMALGWLSSWIKIIPPLTNILTTPWQTENAEYSNCQKVWLRFCLRRKSICKWRPQGMQQDPLRSASQSLSQDLLNRPWSFACKAFHPVKKWLIN